MRSGRSFGPYGCLLFLIGLVLLIAGVATGMVPESLNSIMSNAPDSGKAGQALAIWGAFTFGSLGIGSFGIKYFGLRNSTIGFGVILILCGGVGLFGALTGAGTSNSGNAIWVAMNAVAQMTGSLLITSAVTLGFGLLLVILLSLMGSESQPSPREAQHPVIRNDRQDSSSSIPPGKGKACAKCGHINANWLVSCEKCGTMLPRT